jgi:hypothetical protein
MAESAKSYSKMSYKLVTEKAPKEARTKREATALTQLTANILEIVAAGEKSVSIFIDFDCLSMQCEIIRTVMFETKGFNAFDLFSELREFGPAKQKEL